MRIATTFGLGAMAAFFVLASAAPASAQDKGKGGGGGGGGAQRGVITLAEVTITDVFGNS